MVKEKKTNNFYCFGNNIVSVEERQDFQAVLSCKHNLKKRIQNHRVEEVRKSFG